MYSYNGIGETAITVNDKGAFIGCVAKFKDSDTVGWVAADEVFHGYCLWQRYGTATIQVGGFVTMPYSGTVPTVGYCELVGDGYGYVKVLSGVEGNVARLVVAVDTTEQTVTFLM